MMDIKLVGWGTKIGKQVFFATGDIDPKSEEVADALEDVQKYVLYSSHTINKHFYSLIFTRTSKVYTKYLTINDWRGRIAYMAISLFVDRKKKLSKGVAKSLLDQLMAYYKEHQIDQLKWQVKQTPEPVASLVDIIRKNKQTKELTSSDLAPPVAGNKVLGIEADEDAVALYFDQPTRSAYVGAKAIYYIPQDSSFRPAAALEMLNISPVVYSFDLPKQSTIHDFYPQFGDFNTTIKDVLTGNVRVVSSPHELNELNKGDTVTIQLKKKGFKAKPYSYTVGTDEVQDVLEVEKTFHNVKVTFSHTVPHKAYKVYTTIYGQKYLIHSGIAPDLGGTHILNDVDVEASNHQLLFDFDDHYELIEPIVKDEKTGIYYAKPSPKPLKKKPQHKTDNARNSGVSMARGINKSQSERKETVDQKGKKLSFDSKRLLFAGKVALALLLLFLIYSAIDFVGGKFNMGSFGGQVSERQIQSSPMDSTTNDNEAASISKINNEEIEFKPTIDTSLNSRESIVNWLKNQDLSDYRSEEYRIGKENDELVYKDLIKITKGELKDLVTYYHNTEIYLAKIRPCVKNMKKTETGKAEAQACLYRKKIKSNSIVISAEIGSKQLEYLTLINNDLNLALSYDVND